MTAADSTHTTERPQKCFTDHGVSAATEGVAFESHLAGNRGDTHAVAGRITEEDQISRSLGRRRVGGGLGREVS